MSQRIVADSLDDGAWALAESRRLCGISRRLGDEMRALMVTYRSHRLRLIRGGSGGEAERAVKTNVNETDRGALILAKLASGELPSAKPEKVWAGTGTGQLCAACGARIAATDVEYEVEFRARSLWFHHGCLMIWDREREQPQGNTGGPDTGTAA